MHIKYWNSTKYDNIWRIHCSSLFSFGSNFILSPYCHYFMFSWYGNNRHAFYMYIHAWYHLVCEWYKFHWENKNSVEQFQFSFVTMPNFRLFTCMRTGYCMDFTKNNKSYLSCMITAVHHGPAVVRALDSSLSWSCGLQPHI